MERRALLLGCLLALLGLCLYSGIIGPRLLDTIGEIQAHPELAAGQEIRLVSNVRVLDVAARSVQLEQAGHVITARIPASLEARWSRERSSIRKQEFISLRATYDPQGYLLLEDFHIHHGRTFKIWLSAVTLALATALMIYEWRRATSA